ncbi:hypothetical protein H3N56_11770 [Cetobacterium sp. 2A]|uniref:hypothetical protein n=1 Tax=Cetobacterium sp. 2A TaxID=2754723 RepID=UPI00163C27A4|nr:hypothetical protein [Cetobacterium sp. 2A]MBC2857111.1 hypothetical protein [Cetobacterium sp. 2A]
MKKIMLALFLTISMMSFSLDGHLRFGGVTNANSYNKSDNEFDNYSPTFGLEVTQSFLLFDLGAGITHNRKISGTDISTTPAYLLARWNIIPIVIKPYIVAKVGKDIYTRENASGNIKGKEYYAAGVGMNFSVLQAELLYSVTNMDGDKRGNSNLEQLSVVFGYKFF